MRWLFLYMYTHLIHDVTMFLLFYLLIQMGSLMKVCISWTIDPDFLSLSIWLMIMNKTFHCIWMLHDDYCCCFYLSSEFQLCLILLKIMFKCSKMRLLDPHFLKKSLPWEGGIPPPTPSPRSVASLPRIGHRSHRSSPQSSKQIDTYAVNPI